MVEGRQAPAQPEKTPANTSHFRSLTNFGGKLAVFALWGVLTLAKICHLPSKLQWSSLGVYVFMTLDKSLKVRAGAIKSRNVMTRAERIKRLQDLDKWSDSSVVLGMAKVRVPKISLKKKKKVKKEDEADDKKKKKK